MSDCLFCNIISGDVPSHKIYEDEVGYAFLDINPVNPGHALVIPKAHASDMRESSSEDLAHMMDVVKKLVPSILNEVGAIDFNIVSNIGPIAGQSVFHTHFHIIPRFENDGHKHWKRHGEVVEDLNELSEKIQKKISI